MIKTLFFYLIFTAACCPCRHSDAGYGSQSITSSSTTSSSITMPGRPDHVLFAKLSTGEIVRYHYLSYEPGTYEKKYPELAKSLVYVGQGHVYSWNGIIQKDTSEHVEYFWRKKY